jgi:hypothetical protein
MQTKLTLTIEQSVIEHAKLYARAKERSLSDLVESYLKAITGSASTESVELTPVVKSLKGSFQAPSDFCYEKELTDRLSKKYLNE